jgi:HprK-related kinase A
VNTTGLEIRLASDGLLLRTGPFCIRLRANAPQFFETLRLLYDDTLIVEDDRLPVIDYHIQLSRPRNLRRWWRPQVFFLTDTETPFAPFPLEQAFPLFEWGVNWCIAMQAHQYLMLHAAVVERGGKALILPALPGSGKSTLCAALTYRGWRLLSDEFGLVRPESGTIIPLPRPIPLKNRSVSVFQAFAPEAVVGPISNMTPTP